MRERECVCECVRVGESERDEPRQLVTFSGEGAWSV